MFKSINPYDQSVIEEFPTIDSATLQKKLDLSAKAFQHWRKESFASRAERFNKLAQLLRQNRDTYAQMISVEMGKVFHEAQPEIDRCANTCEFYAIHAEKFLQDQEIITDARKSMVALQPVGAVLAIMPWNFPFWQVLRFAIPTIMAGNVALLKHAPNVCRAALTIVSLFREAGFPEGVFQTLLVKVDTVEKIIQSDVVQAVTLTGSEYAGSQVASIAGRNIKKSVLELGGSDPFIVLPDADVTAAVATATRSRMQNAGQSCICAKRFIVVEQVKGKFIDTFKQNVMALRQGNPLESSITTGPMARLDLAEKLEKQMRDSMKAGAILLAGGERTGCNFTPALLDNVLPGMPAFDQETFGPLACITTVKTEVEAIAYANNTRYGLGASIWSRDVEKATRLAREINSGSVFINALVKSDMRLPFGGVKKSGYGRELSELGIKEFMNAKTIVTG
ncbi:MAG: NAD-dependent succinate-semialdehyde dehydrogenase [Cyclobacteriaceae bacterium]